LIEPKSDPEIQSNLEETLNSRLDRLENENRESRQRSEQRIILAEMKVEAIRSGMIDLDGLKFLDMAQIRLEESGAVAGGSELIAQLKRTKPWLFAVPSSSSIARVPPSKPTRQKLATEMTDDEYRVARQSILKHSVL
jgi:hypothetical protein